MIRYFVLPLILIVLLVAGIMLVPDGDVLLRGFGKEAQITNRAAVVGLVAATLAIILIWSVISFVFRLPSRINQGLGMRRRNQALEAMEDALIAGAEGNPTLARKRSEDARRLIDSPDLGRIVSAQAAEASGDTEEAIAQYTAMLDAPRTVPTAQRGLSQAYLQNGNYAAAIEHAHLAYSQNRNARWAFDTLFRAQVLAHCWNDALETLAVGEDRRHVDAEVARRRRAVLRTALADRLEELGRAEQAREIAVSAAAEAPDFSPAVALASRLLTRVGDTRRARKLIEAAWSRRPHPALGLAYRDVLAAQDDGVAGKLTRKVLGEKTIEGLARLNPEHRESILLEVEETLAAGNAVRALSLLTPMLDETPTARLCILAARAEDQLGNSQDAAIWMERAATAPAEGDWSDLDPSGDAFTYDDRDWHQLVSSFGERGELIHPRLDANAPRFAPTVPAPKVGKPPAASVATAPVVATQPDLAERLDKLIED